MSDADGRAPSPDDIRVQVLGPIPRGGILVVPALKLPERGVGGDHPLDVIRDNLVEVAGHDQFVLLMVEGAGDVALVDARADAAEVVRRLNLYRPPAEESAQAFAGTARIDP